MGLLSEMTVRYAVDLSNLTSGISQAKSSMSSMSDATAQATTGLKQMSGAADLSKVVSGVDVARANLTLLESKVQEARGKLQTLQNAADAGQAVKGIPEAEANLTLLEAKAQGARANLQQLQEQEMQTGSAAMQMAEEEQQAASATEQLGTRSGGLLSGLKGAIGGVVDFGAKIGQTVFGLQALGQTAIGLGSALLQPNASMEQTTVAFETLLGKGKQTQDFLQQMKDFAAATPFEFPEVATAAQHMLAFGFQAKQVIPTLTNIGDAMGSMGKGAGDIDHIVEVFGQMHAAGKLNAGDMMQLADEGIPAWKMLAESMHKTVPEVQKLTTQGLIPADTAIQAVSNGMHKMFGGGMAAQANTFNGLMSTLQDNASAAMRAFTGPLFDQAKSGLTQLGNLVSSKQFQQFATDMGTKLGAGLAVVVPAFIRLGQAVSGTIQFFQQNQVALDALGAVLVGIGAGLLAFAVTQIPILIAGLGAWAVAQWAVLAPLLATAAPFILIGAAVAGLVLIFMQLYQHFAPFHIAVDSARAALSNLWGIIASQLMPALRQVGAFLVSTFAPVWQQLVQVWKTQMLPALLQMWTALQPIMPVLQGIGAIIAGVVIVSFILLIGVLAGVAKGFAGMLSGLAVAIGGIVQIFSGLVQIISGIIAVIVDLCTGNFTKLGADLGTIWQGVATMFTGIWNVISGVFSGAIGLVTGLVSGFVSTVVNIFTGLADQLVGHSIIPDMVNGIINWIAQLPGRAAGAISGFVSTVLGQLQNLAAQCLNIGSNIVMNIVNGITGSIGQAAAAAQNLAATIASYLPHSPAEKGPLRTVDKWMPSFVKMLSSDLIAGQSQIAGAANTLASSLAIASPASPRFPVSSGAVTSAAISRAGASAGGGYGATREQHFHLEVDSMELAHIVNNATDRHVRLKLGPRGRSA